MPFLAYQLIDYDGENASRILVKMNTDISLFISIRCESRLVNIRKAVSKICKCIEPLKEILM